MADAFTIKLLGDKALEKKLVRTQGFFKSTALKTLLEDAENRIVMIASRLAPKGDSRLLSQIVGAVERFGTPNVVIRVRSPQHYAIHQEFGVEPHIIQPIEKKVMFWYQYDTPKHRLGPGPAGNTPAGAVFSFVQRPVLHPGHQAQPFMRPAVQQVQPRFVKALKRVLQEFYQKN